MENPALLPEKYPGINFQVRSFATNSRNTCAVAAIRDDLDGIVTATGYNLLQNLTGNHWIIIIRVRNWIMTEIP